MSAVPKADVQNVRIRVELYGCSWPKADVREQLICTVLHIDTLRVATRNAGIVVGTSPLSESVG